MIPFMDTPNHEAYLPNNAKTEDTFKKLGSDLLSNPNLDLDKRIAEFTTELDKVLKEKPK